MDFPSWFDTDRGKVCKLKKSLYGLKQSPRTWFDKFTKAVKSKGYLQAQYDHTLFIKHSNDSRKAILTVYVDDIIITGDNRDEVEHIKVLLSREFKLKELGTLRYFLGMKVARSKSGI